MELDPHQLIEGCLIACYAAGLSQCFLYIRGEMAARPGARRDRAQRGLRRRLRRHEHPRHRLLRRHRDAVGRRRLRRRRGDGAHREPRGQPRHAPPEAAVLPGRHRPVRPADDRQQRRDARQPAVAAAPTAPPPTRRSAPRRRPARAWSPSPATSSGPACSRSSTARRRSATCIYGEEFCQGIRDGNELKAFVPGGGSAPWFLPDQLDLPFEGKLVGAAGSMLGSGAIMVMDETTDIPTAALTLARFYAHESCGKCVPCREGGTWLERILHAHRATATARPRTSTCCSRSASRSAPAPSPRVERAARPRGRAVPVQDDDDLLRRPVGLRPDPLGADAVPRRVRGQDQAAHAHPRRRGRRPGAVSRRRRRRLMADAPEAGARPASPARGSRGGRHRAGRRRRRRAGARAGPERRADHDQRPAGHGPQGRADHRRRRARRARTSRGSAGTTG